MVVVQSHSNPELLRFAWFKDSFSYLQASAVKENHINGPGTLRVNTALCRINLGGNVCFIGEEVQHHLFNKFLFV